MCQIMDNLVYLAGQAGPKGPARPLVRHGHTRAAAAAAAVADACSGGGESGGSSTNAVVRFSLCWGVSSNPAQTGLRTGIQIVEPGSSDHV